MKSVKDYKVFQALVRLFQASFTVLLVMAAVTVEVEMFHPPLAWSLDNTVVVVRMFYLALVSEVIDICVGC